MEMIILAIRYFFVLEMIIPAVKAPVRPPVTKATPSIMLSD